MAQVFCWWSLFKSLAQARTDHHQWIQTSLWGLAAVGLFFGYKPPKRHTRLDHLSFGQKLAHIDIAGFGLLSSGLTLFLVGANLGGGLYSWTAAAVLAPLIIGIIFLCVFALYEWKSTKTGILHHTLFRGGKNYGRTFAVCAALISLEGILLFGFLVYTPIL